MPFWTKDNTEMSSTPTLEPLPPDISRGSDLVIVSWLTVSIALLLVSLRFYIRGVLRKNVGWDDYLIFLATTLAIAQSVASTLQVQNGFGRNIQYLNPGQIQNFRLYTNVYVLLHTVGAGLVRVSVCLFVLRLLPATTSYYRRWIWALLIFNTIISLADFLALCFQCIPFSGLWNQSIKARCFPRADMTRVAQVQGGTAVITDLLCVLLPMLVFRRLQVSLRDKVAIFVMLGLGFFTAVAAIARTVLIDLTGKNPTWELLPVGIWACLEQNIGIAVASMPALGQLINIRKKQNSSHLSEPLYNQNNSTHAPGSAIARLSYNDCIRIPDDDYSAATSSREFSAPTAKMSDIENCHDRRGSQMRLSMVSPPFWAERKISSAETVEMSRVTPNTTFVERKPATAESLRLSMVTPSWGHKETSAVGRASNMNKKRLSLVSPLTVDRPPPLFSAGRMQQLGRFEETGLRNSRVATPEEISTLGNPAAMGYSC